MARFCIRGGCAKPLAGKHRDAKYCADCGAWAISEALRVLPLMIGVRYSCGVHWNGKTAHLSKLVPTRRVWRADDAEKAAEYIPKGQATDCLVAILKRAFPRGSARAIVPYIIGWSEIGECGCSDCVAAKRIESDMRAVAAQIMEG